MVMETTIARGAEAVISKVGDTTIVKLRVRKGYRLPEIDLKIRKTRTRLEARLLQEARRAGVPVPNVIECDEDSGKLVMEFVDGERVKELFSSGRFENVCRIIGKEVGLLHAAGIAHGDLTTSNMILKDGKVYIIDFGLAKKTKSVEDFAVDLHLLERALTSAHCDIAEKCFDEVLEEYVKLMPNSVVERLKEIEKRGRYKAR